MSDIWQSTNIHKLAGVDLAGRNHVCAFFNTTTRSTECSAVLQGRHRRAKRLPIVDPSIGRALKRLSRAGIDVQKMMSTSQLEVVPWTTYMCAITTSTRTRCDCIKTDPIGHRCRYPLTRRGHHMDGCFRQTLPVQPGWNTSTTQSRFSKYDDPVICNYIVQVCATVAMDNHADIPP